MSSKTIPPEWNQEKKEYEAGARHVENDIQEEVSKKALEKVIRVKFFCRRKLSDNLDDEFTQNWEYVGKYWGCKFICKS